MKYFLALAEELNFGRAAPAHGTAAADAPDPRH
jgi:DNA-binding transcriptional LysR family regulator